MWAGLGVQPGVRGPLALRHAGKPRPCPPPALFRRLHCQQLFEQQLKSGHRTSLPKASFPTIECAARWGTGGVQPQGHQHLCERVSGSHRQGGAHAASSPSAAYVVPRVPCARRASSPAFACLTREGVGPATQMHTDTGCRSGASGSRRPTSRWRVTTRASTASTTSPAVRTGVALWPMHAPARHHTCAMACDWPVDRRNKRVAWSRGSGLRWALRLTG